MSAPSMDSIAGSFVALQAAFLPDKTANVDRTIQFDFTGREAGTWTLIVRNGTFAANRGQRNLLMPPSRLTRMTGLDFAGRTQRSERVYGWQAEGVSAVGGHGPHVLPDLVRPLALT